MSQRLRVELRRDDTSLPSLVDDGEPLLVEAIRAEITTRGPITFARFMERALYEPGLGYYATRPDRPTRSGDFLTAPELHPIFAWTLAGQVDEMWRWLGSPADFVLREYGAGSGALFTALLDGLVQAGSGLASSIRYQPIDLPLQTQLIGQRLADTGRADVVEAPPVDEQFVGCILANEFLDALPVHRVVQVAATLREIYVDWRDERFVEVVGALSDSRLGEFFSAAGVALADGQRAEVNLAQSDWLMDAAGALKRGYVMVIGIQVDKASEAWGVKVLRYEIKNITPPQDILAAMEKQMRAEREKRAIVLTSEGVRDAAINKAEGEKQQVIKASEARKQQQINEAEGQGSAILTVATATGSGIRQVAEAILAPGGFEAVQLRVAEQYINQFGNLAKQGNTLIVPANLTDVASMIGAAMSVIRAGAPHGQPSPNRPPQPPPMT